MVRKTSVCQQNGQPPPNAFLQLLQSLQAPLPSTFRPPRACFPYGGGALQPSRQQLYGSYQASQGSDDDWDDEWDDSSTVADEPGALGSGAYLGLDGSSAVGASPVGGQELGPGDPQPHPLFHFCHIGWEAFVLGEASGSMKDRDKLCVVLRPYGPEWQENPYPFQCTIDDPTKQTKFQRYEELYFLQAGTHAHAGANAQALQALWLYAHLAEKFHHLCAPLAEKQATGPFEEDFISKCKKGLICWVNHMASHPVLAQCDVFQHFLTWPSSTDEKAWKQGKRKAEKDEMEVESKIDGFKCFPKKMDDSTLQLNHTANKFPRKQVTGFKKEYQKVGQSFRGLSQAFELDQQPSSAGLNQAIAFTGDAYDVICELFAEQTRQDLDPVMDLLALYQGHLANFPDIIHVQKGALTKVKESRGHMEEEKMEVQKADGIQDRWNTISFATLAEIDHFHSSKRL
ncbi:Sorting nexin-18 [Sciurus carolinensis]|uniref:Sorting nexin-18 n=1 Tax=Sciurus carolinensis TaxID=30640 RepID=A0AA41MPF5_SCICA|nr:Sorting nexin-18 [Sciurus carolinensis]